MQLCGDAHVHNLGAYAAPDGQLVFDINDFDETTPGPWEWDLKRLATSLVLAGGGSRSIGERGAKRACARWSRRTASICAQFALMPFAHARPPSHYAATGATACSTNLPGRPAHHAGSESQEAHRPHGGRFRFHDRKPDLEHVPSRTAARVVEGLKNYAVTLNASRRRTFERYRPADVAFKLVGTGSVGTRDYVVLLFGNDANDPLFMQVKQELPSCYAPYLSAPRPRVVHQGRRVAEGQQMMQTASDPFLGYTRFGGHDYLVRQLADHKAGLVADGAERRCAPRLRPAVRKVLAKGMRERPTPRSSRAMSAAPRNSTQPSPPSRSAEQDKKDFDSSNG